MLTPTKSFRSSFEHMTNYHRYGQCYTPSTFILMNNARMATLFIRIAIPSDRLSEGSGKCFTAKVVGMLRSHEELSYAGDVNSLGIGTTPG